METVINCFRKCGFCKERPDVQVLNQNEDKELENFVNKLLSGTTLNYYINFDMNFATSKSPIDTKTIAWQQES